jgi:hypothetical protein
VLYVLKEKLDHWTTIPQQYMVTVLIDGSTLRYTSWFRAGFLHNLGIVASSAALVSRPHVSSPDMVHMQSNNPDVTRSGQYR